MRVCHTCRADKEDQFFAVDTHECRQCTLTATRREALARLELLDADDWVLMKEVEIRRAYVQSRLIPPCQLCAAPQADNYVRERGRYGEPDQWRLGDHWKMCEQLVTRRFLRLYLSQLAHLCRKCAAKPAPRWSTKTPEAELAHARAQLKTWWQIGRRMRGDAAITRNKAIFYWNLQVRRLVDAAERTQAGTAPLREEPVPWFCRPMPDTPPDIDEQLPAPSDD